MANVARQRRLADRIRHIVADMLELRIKDPRLGFVTITDVRVTPDLREASIFYTVYGDVQEQEASAQALASATGVIRSEVENKPASSSRRRWSSFRTRFRRTLDTWKNCSPKRPRRTPRSTSRQWAPPTPGRPTRTGIPEKTATSSGPHVGRGSRRSKDDPSVAGVLCVDKPSGLTSHDVVDRVRRRLSVRRVGHAGTLTRWPPESSSSAWGPLLIVGNHWRPRQGIHRNYPPGCIDDDRRSRRRWTRRRPRRTSST